MVLVIAEAGVNHNGNKELAFKLVEEAKKAGADIVKFQTYKTSELVTYNAKKANYQVNNTGETQNQYDMLKKLELSYDAHKDISHCKEIGIEYFSTAFDSDSLNFLYKNLNLKRLKIPSGDLTNAPLVLEHARTGCDLIVSTGMATLEEIRLALSVIAFGYIAKKDEYPSLEKFKQAYETQAAQDLLKKKVIILHCTSEYPAPVEEINLRAMDTLGDTFDIPIGYSDHSEGVIIPVAAAARGLW